MMQGGNPEDMERVRGVIEAKRDEIDRARTVLQGRVDSLIPTIWNGPDADAFVAEFNSDVIARFEAVLADMDEASAELGRNAEEQRQTSAQ